jgi:hypothetical protein
VYALISTDRFQMPPGAVMRIPETWQDYCQLRDSRGDGSINLYLRSRPNSLRSICQEMRKPLVSWCR